MFCWPCIIVYQYNETNVMHFLFNLLRIKGLYLFRALLAHPQEALHKRQLAAPGLEFTPVLVQPTDVTRTQYTKCRLCSSSWGWARKPPEDEQIMLETCRGPNWIKSALRWFHYTEIGLYINCPLFWSCFMELEFSRKCSKNFMKIRPLEDELFHVDLQTGSRAWRS
jgi:hypothetical protein